MTDPTVPTQELADALDWLTRVHDSGASSKRLRIVQQHIAEEHNRVAAAVAEAWALGYKDSVEAYLAACAALSPDRIFMCDQPRGHDGDHEGSELPTVFIDATENP